MIITNDLDFSAILAAGAVDGPSVVQLRTQDLLSESAARIVARALEAHLRTSSEARSRRLTKAGARKDAASQGLAGSLVAAIPLASADPRPSPWLRDCLTSIDEKLGEHRLGSCVPLDARLPSKRGAA